MRALFKNKWLLWFSVICFGVVLLVGLFYIVENWRGARAWEKAQEELRAAGISTRFEDYVPPEVPDEENFCMAPIFLAVEDVEAEDGSKNRGNDPYMKDLHQDLETMKKVGSLLKNKSGSWREGMKTEFITRSKAGGSAEEEIAEMLAPMEKYFEELGVAAERRYARNVIDYTLVPDLDFGRFISMSSKFRGPLWIGGLRYLRVGNPTAAFRNFKILHRFQDVYRDERLLVSAALRKGLLSFASVQLIWEGLQMRIWDREQLKEMQELMSDIDLLKHYREALTCETVPYMGLCIERIRTDGEWREIFLNIYVKESWKKIWYDYSPRGWYDQNRATLGRFAKEFSKMDGVREEREFFSKWKSEKESMYNVVLLEGFDILEGQHQSGLHIQAAVDQVETACALERYYIDKGEYPDALEGLVPEYMESVPLDVMDDKPLRYARTGDGRYKIYSVGLNGVDDGGVRGLVNGKFDMRRAKDWVWSYEGGE